MTRYRLLVATSALVLAACGTSAGTASPPSSPAAQPTSRSSPTTGPSLTTSLTATGPSLTTSRTSSRTSDARTQVQSVIAHHPAGGISVASLNTHTGASYSAGSTSGMWMASAYKLFVLETLLLRRQHAGGLTGFEQSASVPMIEQSDNVAGYELWEDAGGNAGLASTARRLQLRHTVPGRSDPTFTTSSGPDCLKLLQALVDPDGPLTTASRRFALQLMRNVEDDQRWGAGQAADPHTTFANKNGWLAIDDSNGPGEDDDGRWAVNSLGIVTVHGQQLLLAVLTRHDADFDSGKELVAQLAKLSATIATG